MAVLVVFFFNLDNCPKVDGNENMLILSTSPLPPFGVYHMSVTSYMINNYQYETIMIVFIYIVLPVLPRNIHTISNHPPKCTLVPRVRVMVIYLRLSINFYLPEMSQFQL